MSVPSVEREMWGNIPKTGEGMFLRGLLPDFPGMPPLPPSHRASFPGHHRQVMPADSVQDSEQARKGPFTALSF